MVNGDNVFLTLIQHADAFAGDSDPANIRYKC